MLYNLIIRCISTLRHIFYIIKSNQMTKAMTDNNKPIPGDQQNTDALKDSKRPKELNKKNNTPNPEQYSEQKDEELRMKPQPLQAEG